MSVVDTGLVTASELELLRSVVEGTAHATGDDFLRNLVRRVAEALGVHHAFVSELLPEQRVRTLAFWSHGRIVDNVEYDLPGTPCQEVIAGGICHVPSGVQVRYAPREAGIEGYLGVALKSQAGKVLGHLCAFDEEPMPQPTSSTRSVGLMRASRASVSVSCCWATAADSSPDHNPWWI